MKRFRRLDLTSVLGIPIGIGLVLLGQLLEGGSLHTILQFTAAVIVLGGTFGATILSFSSSDITRALGSLKDVFVDQQTPADETIAAMARLAMKARRDGIMSLEDDVERVPDAFMRRGLGLAVDGTNPTTLRAMLEAEAAARDEAGELPARVYECAGGYAPTMGIIGAVLGLIHVMENLSDPNKLGAGIAVAFVATVYGVGSANLLLLPIANKLRSKAAAAARRRDLVLEGILAIQEGQNPRLIEQKLRGLAGADESRATAVSARKAA